MGEQPVGQRRGEMALELAAVVGEDGLDGEWNTAWIKRKNWAAAALAWLWVAQAQAKWECRSVQVIT